MVILGKPLCRPDTFQAHHPHQFAEPTSLVLLRTGLVVAAASRFVSGAHA